MAAGKNDDARASGDRSAASPESRPSRIERRADPYPKGSYAGPRIPGDVASFPGQPFAFRPGEVLARFAGAGAAGGVKAALARMGFARSVEELLPEGGGPLERLALGVTFDPERAALLLEALPQVVYAEPDYAARLDYAPTDPDYQPEQWGLNNYGQVIEGQTGLPGADIGAEEAWGIEKGFSDPVTVAVVDTGMDLAHPDLDGNVWDNAGEVPGNGADDDFNGYADDALGYNWAGITQGRYYFYDYVEEEYSTTAWYFGYSSINQVLAQSIRGTGSQLTHVGVLLQKVGSPPAGISVSVRSSLNGADLASFSIAPGEVSEMGGEVYKLLSTPISLADGAAYYLVFQTSNLDTSNHYYLYHNFVDDPPDPDTDQYDPYRDGHEYRWNGFAWQEFDSWDFYFRTNPNANPRDDNGHGTHVGGIAGAEEGNGEGGVGISFGARLMPLKVLDCTGSGTYADIVSGIRYAADNGAEVINLSLGGTAYSAAMQDAVDYARGKGVVVVASAGNNGDGTVLYPAGCEGVAGVGATTNRDERAGFSNYNQYMDLVAPGLFIYFTMPTYPVALNSWGYGNGYDYLSGTSMAAPMVSGVAALVRSFRPGYGPDDVQDAMQENAKDLGAPGRDDEFGYGRMDAAATLEAIGAAPLLASLSPSRGGVGEKVTLEGEAFGPSRGGSAVAFGGEEATLYDSWSDTSVTCYVPAGVSGIVEVTVTTDGGTSNALAFTVSGPAPSATWYLSEGCTEGGFEIWVLVQNPGDEPASVAIDFQTSEGPVGGPRETVPARSRRTYDLGKYVTSWDVSTAVTSDRPVVCERAVYGGGRTFAHDSIGATAPSATWYLSEGCTEGGFEIWVLVQNPGDEPASVAIDFQTSEGPVGGPRETVPARSRRTYDLGKYVTSWDVSTAVTSDRPVVCERAVYGGGRTFAHDSIGYAP